MRLTAVTAANQPFKEMVRISQWSTERLGYRHIVYDLDAANVFRAIFGEPPPRTEKEMRLWKPRYMLMGRRQLSDDVVFWLDADSVVHSDFSRDLSGEFDIGLVVLPKLKLCASPVFIKDTEQARWFMDQYIYEARHGRGDMYALRRLFGRYYPTITRSMVGEIVPVEGVQIKLFDGAYYCYKVRTDDDLDIPFGVKVVHFSGQGPTRESKRPQKLPLMQEYARRMV